MFACDCVLNSAVDTSAYKAMQTWPPCYERTTGSGCRDGVLRTGVKPRCGPGGPNHHLHLIAHRQGRELRVPGDGVRVSTGGSWGAPSVLAHECVTFETRKPVSRPWELPRNEGRRSIQAVELRVADWRQVSDSTGAAAGLQHGCARSVLSWLPCPGGVATVGCLKSGSAGVPSPLTRTHSTLRCPTVAGPERKVLTSLISTLKSP